MTKTYRLTDAQQAQLEVLRKEGLAPKAASGPAVQRAYILWHMGAKAGVTGKPNMTVLNRAVSVLLGLPSHPVGRAGSAGRGMYRGISLDTLSGLTKTQARAITKRLPTVYAEELAAWKASRAGGRRAPREIDADAVIGLF